MAQGEDNEGAAGSSRRGFLTIGFSAVGVGLAGAALGPAAAMLAHPLGNTTTSGTDAFVPVGGRTGFGDEPVKVDIFADRVDACFPSEPAAWRDELCLDRYELLYEAQMVAEAWRDRGADAPAAETPGGGAPAARPPAGRPPTGRPLWRDHRRILATGIARLRGKLKYRPVLFELMPGAFTLLELQRAAEAVQGVPLHKQNFRRQVDRSGLVEPTGAMTSRHGGRPAAEFRFTADAGWERVMTPVRFGGARKG